MTNRAGDKETAQFMGALMEPTDDHAAAVQMAGLLAKKVQQNVSNSATVTAEAHLDGGGHVTFLPVPEDQRARRAKERVVGAAVQATGWYGFFIVSQQVTGRLALHVKVKCVSKATVVTAEVHHDGSRWW
jgi:hypothetical protein